MKTDRKKIIGPDTKDSPVLSDKGNLLLGLLPIVLVVTNIAPYF
jgi:hypothetical protein